MILASKGVHVRQSLNPKPKAKLVSCPSHISRPVTRVSSLPDSTDHSDEQLLLLPDEDIEVPGSYFDALNGNTRLGKAIRSACDELEHLNTMEQETMQQMETLFKKLGVATQTLQLKELEPSAKVALGASAVESVADLPAAVESAADLPAAVESVADLPAAVESVADLPAAVESVADLPAAVESVADLPAAVESVADLPAAGGGLSP
ncbi:hypothetical protein CEUSTIGMA_g12623.t1 [Chlamydomonas eustigma]|uniref:Uncharacterized protein n=1 Tax=Chlamydomonas eustigma TaxID=1157962 RepID=A0A250XQA0_9CHLO|nr:hypothetical protein CEUSTIGMA_g12623.t1 [Chlamydomonas eustigma]|eukprot:GAX85203.1 hypothetical protein CEUSTIGMA_g12623.t1 [Chlamydomonas eustigma]